MGDDQQSSLQELFELGEGDDAESVDEEPALRRFLDPVHDYGRAMHFDVELGGTN